MIAASRSWDLELVGKAAQDRLLVHALIHMFKLKDSLRKVQSNIVYASFQVPHKTERMIKPADLELCQPGCQCARKRLHCWRIPQLLISRLYTDCTPILCTCTYSTDRRSSHELGHGTKVTTGRDTAAVLALLVLPASSARRTSPYRWDVVRHLHSDSGRQRGSGSL